MLDDTTGADQAGSPLDRRLTVTVFHDFSATEKIEAQMSFRDLQEPLLTATAASKSKLPWVKVAQFGDDRTANGSLRHDGNVLAIEGIEVDYDGGRVTVDQALSALEAAGIAALVYTSPSHTEDSHRWRVLCPTSKPLPTAEREGLCARLNGVLGGIVDGVSFTLSQAYYFGSVNQNPSHRVELVDGRAIDLAPDLDANAIGKPGRKGAEAAQAKPQLGLPPDAERLLRMSPLGQEADQLDVAAALAVIPNSGMEDWNDWWNPVGMAAWAATRGSEFGFAAFDAWSARNDRYDPQATAERWAQYHRSPPTSIGAGTLFHLAQQAQPGWRKPSDGAKPKGEGDSKEAPKKRLRLLSIDDVEALPDPTWLVHGLLPELSLTIAYGPPKHGKTFIALSMALHVAAGRPWFGREVQQGGVVYIAGEGAGGLKLRIKAARAHYGLPPDIPFWVLPRAVNFSEPKAVAELADLIRETVDGQPVRLVIMDTLARAMPGLDENSAGEIGRVIAACDWLKDQLSCAVIPIHHAGKDADKGMRGSSALDGGTDALLQVTRQNKTLGEDVVTLTTIYMKDAEEGPPVFFDLLKVPATEERSSLVPVLRTTAAPAKPKLTDAEQAAIQHLQDMLREAEGKPVLMRDWRERCVQRGVSIAKTEENRDRAVRRIVRHLQTERLIISEGENGRVWLPSEFDALPFGADRADRTGQNPDMSGLSARQNTDQDRTDRTGALAPSVSGPCDAHLGVGKSSPRGSTQTGSAPPPPPGVDPAWWGSIPMDWRDSFGVDDLRLMFPQ